MPTWAARCNNHLRQCKNACSAIRTTVRELAFLGIIQIGAFFMPIVVIRGAGIGSATVEEFARYGYAADLESVKNLGQFTCPLWTDQLG